MVAPLVVFETLKVSVPLDGQVSSVLVSVNVEFDSWPKANCEKKASINNRYSLLPNISLSLKVTQDNTNSFYLSKILRNKNMKGANFAPFIFKNFWLKSKSCPYSPSRQAMTSLFYNFQSACHHRAGIPDNFSHP